MLAAIVSGGMWLPAYAAAGGAAQDSATIGEVVVTGTRGAADVRHLPLTVSVVNRKALTGQYRHSVLPTVGERVPGLFVTSRGVLGYGVSTGSAGSVKVRGVGGGASTLVLIDGLPQYAGLMGHPIPDAYQTMLADRVEVVRGPASLLYGSNAMGGVVNIVTRQLRSDGSRTSVNIQGGSYGTVQGAMTTTVRKGRLQSVLGFDYGRTDGHRANSEFGQYSGFAKVGYDVSRRWTLMGDVSMTYFEASNPGTVQSPLEDNDSRVMRGMASVSLTNGYGRTSGALRVFGSWGHHEINDGYRAGGSPREYLYLHDDFMGGVSVYQSVSLFRGNRMTVGFDWQRFGGRAVNDSLANAGRKILGDRRLDGLAAYLELRQELAPWLTVDLGLRADHNSQAGTELVPQGGVTVRLNPDGELKALVSKGFRNPTIREMYMFPPANDALRPERMMNYELAYSQRLLSGRMRIGANVFYLKADNMINIVVVDGSNRNMNTGAMENCGAEVEADLAVTGHLRVNANYSFLHMDNPVTGAPEHKLYVGGNYSAGRMSLTGGLQYVAGLYTATGAAQRREQFWLLGITAGYDLSPSVRLFARGENLLAQQYETNYGFPMPRATVTGGVSWEF